MSRKSRTLDKKNKVILCACEGTNKTEMNYFKRYNNRGNKYTIKFTKGNATDPVNMVKYLVKKMKQEDISTKNGDKIYCIFDADTNESKQKQIEEAKKIADKHGIELVISIPSFEIWFLLHFNYYTRYLDNTSLLHELKRYIPTYKKSEDVYDILLERKENAIKNAKKLEEYQKDRGFNKIDVKCNPYTSVYKIIEDLDKINEENK